MFDWMFWTAPVAYIFVGIFVMLVGMTVWGHYSPPIARQGFLRFPTDRGDRLYVCLLTFGAINVVWLATTSATGWGGFALGLAGASIVMRWG